MYPDRADSASLQSSIVDPQGLLPRLKQYAGRAKEHVARAVSIGTLIAAGVLPNTGCVGCGEAHGDEGRSRTLHNTSRRQEPEPEQLPECPRNVSSIAFQDRRPSVRDMQQYQRRMNEQAEEVAELRRDGTELTEEMERYYQLESMNWTNGIVEQPDQYLRSVLEVLERAIDFNERGGVAIDIYGSTDLTSSRADPHAPMFERLSNQRADMVRHSLEFIINRYNEPREEREQIDTDNIHTYSLGGVSLFGTERGDNNRVLIVVRELLDGEGQEGYEQTPADLGTDTILALSLRAFPANEWRCADYTPEEPGVVDSNDPEEVEESRRSASYRRIELINNILDQVNDYPDRRQMLALHRLSLSELRQRFSRYRGEPDPEQEVEGHMLAGLLPIPAGTQIVDSAGGGYSISLPDIVRGSTESRRPDRSTSRRVARSQPRRERSTPPRSEPTRRSRSKTRSYTPRPSADSPEMDFSQEEAEETAAPAVVAAVATVKRGGSAVRPASATEGPGTPVPVSGLSSALGFVPPPAPTGPSAPEQPEAPDAGTPPTTPTPPERPRAESRAERPAEERPAPASSRGAGGYVRTNPYAAPQERTPEERLGDIVSLYQRIVRELDEGFNLGLDGHQVYDPETQSDHLPVGYCDSSVIDDLTQIQSNASTLSLLGEVTADELTGTRRELYQALLRLTTADSDNPHVGPQCVARYARLRQNFYDLSQAVEDLREETGLVCGREGSPAYCADLQETLREYADELLEQLDRVVASQDTYQSGRRRIDLSRLRRHLPATEEVAYREE
ncbi:hypothetical protein KY362_02730 [Candidatus Woesearchaeota archaeon]|nr:hypothetical protein [Candidatus Woesearchaeota archaeon]